MNDNNIMCIDRFIGLGVGSTAATITNKNKTCLCDVSIFEQYILAQKFLHESWILGGRSPSYQSDILAQPDYCFETFLDN